jgi:glycosyltransferase involved in cell wall biosynthesis
MRILFLSPRQSVPARSGARLREFHFLQALGRSAEVTYLYFADPDGPAPTREDLPFCREAIGIPKPPAYGLAKTLRGVAGRWPLPILNYSSAGMSDAVARVMENGVFDIIHLDSIHMIRYAREAAARRSSPRAIYNWHNIESEAMRRYGGTTSSGARRWYAGHTAAKMERIEANILHSAFGHIVCSERERDQLVAATPTARIAVVENGVDTSYFAGAGAATADSGRIVFVGAMDYFPNSDAAIHFANRIWPEIRSRLDGVGLVIVGANPGQGVLALGALPGVQVTGMVADVRPWYAGALAAVVPLRTGGGTRLKILEAMAAGVPVLSTPLGAEGLDVADGENVLLVESDDSAGWADRLAALAQSPGRREKLTGAALQLVRNRYDWAILGSKLRTTYENWLAESER